MRVGQIMHKDPVTISPEKRVGQALKLMQELNIRHLPVMKGGHMVGWITSRLLREVLLASMLEVITVEDVMIEAPITVSPDTGVEEAARLMYEHKIGGMPVMEQDKLVGVITTPDLLAAFLSMLGLLRSSSRLDVLLDKDPAVLEEVSTLVEQTGGKIINIAMGPTRGKRRRHVFRLQKCDLKPIVEALKQAGHQVLDVIP
jgi:acetoin utilization protein AcuB